MSREHKKVYSKEEREAIIIAGFQNNIPLKDIAAILKCSTKSVSVTASKLRSQGIDIPIKLKGIRHLVPPEKMTDYLSLRGKHFNKAEIVQILNLNLGGSNG